MQYLAVIILLFALLPMTAVAQDDVEDERPWSPEVVVSPVKLNVIYRGVDNPIEVAVPGVLCEDLDVTVSHGRVKGSRCNYVLHVGNDPAHELRLIVSWNAGGERMTAESLIRVKDLPLPNACFAGTCTDPDTVPVANLTAAQGVTARLFHFDINLNLHVVHYRIRILRDCMVIFDGRSMEARLAKEMEAALQDVEGEDQVMLTEIRVKDLSGSIKEIAPLRLIAK